MGQRRYTDDEAREILRRAMESEQAAKDGLDHEDLIDAAAEVGISPDAMRRAAEELRLESAALDVLRERRRGKQRRWFGSLAIFGVVNGFLFVLDVLTPGGPWFYWPLLMWGFFVAMGGLRAFLPEGDDKKRRKIEKEIERIKRREEKEARRRAKEARKRARGGSTDIEAAIEDGVSALLGAAARGIQNALESHPPADSEFQRYVDGRSGKRRSAPQGRDAARPDHRGDVPRSRVDAAGSPAEEEEVSVEARRRRERAR